MNKETYVEIKNCPFDLEDNFFKKIPRYKIKDKEYVKINVLYAGWEKMRLVDIELTEQECNFNSGKFNGFGIIPKRDFSPCNTEFIKVF